MLAHIGTSGFYYRNWAGSFYPEDTRSNRLLEHYSSCFNTVEINSSFYGRPSKKVLGAWSGQVPGGFVFSIKAPSYITHGKRLRNAGESVGEFYSLIKSAGVKFRAVLFQLPPSLGPDLPLLADFLPLLDPAFVNVFEFGHGGWHNGGVYSLLDGRGAAACAAISEVPCYEIPAAGGIVYARFHGNKKGKYSKRELSGQLATLMRPGLEMFIYFNNDSLYSLENALTMKELFENAEKN